LPDVVSATDVIGGCKTAPGHQASPSSGDDVTWSCGRACTPRHHGPPRRQHDGPASWRRRHHTRSRRRRPRCCCRLPKTAAVEFENPWNQGRCRAVVRAHLSTTTRQHPPGSFVERLFDPVDGCVGDELQRQRPAVQRDQGGKSRSRQVAVYTEFGTRRGGRSDQRGISSFSPEWGGGGLFCVVLFWGCCWGGRFFFVGCFLLGGHPPDTTVPARSRHRKPASRFRSHDRGRCNVGAVAVGEVWMVFTPHRARDE